ncbi:MAG: DUF2188 domain-containing protein [Bacteroidetes bacterium]|nr:DUF2188 domain-containing protein [Bacteroidota bacterium]
MAANIHVVPYDNEWAAKMEGYSNPLAICPTQELARQAAVLYAKALKSEVVIHRPDGTIRDKDSYGNDPFPPRDQRR